MKIDIMTAMAAGITLLVVMSCLFLFFWVQDRQSRWLVWLVAPYVLGAAGVALLVARWQVADYLALGVGYGLIVSAFGLLWQGVRIFERRKLILWPVLVATAGWLALAFIPGALEEKPLLIGVMSTLNALFCGLTALELWRGRAEKLPSRMSAMVVALSYGTLMLVRVGLLRIAPYPFGGLPLDANWVGVYNLIAFTHLAAFAVLMVTLTKERREMEHRNDALTDPLTGMFNRRAFSAQSQRMVHRRKYGREQTSLMVLDLDSFKTVNDRFGHEAGDRVLLGFASAAEASLGTGDLLYRMGGDEFCFVLPNTSLAQAIQSAEQIRRNLEMLPVDIGGEELQVTVSVGIATTDHAGFDLDVLLAAADAALYEAKARGRNRVVVAEPTAIKRPHKGAAGKRDLSARA